MLLGAFGLVYIYRLKCRWQKISFVEGIRVSNVSLDVYIFIWPLLSQLVEVRECYKSAKITCFLNFVTLRRG